MMNRTVNGPYDEVDNIYRWRETLSAEVQVGGVVNLLACEEERQIDTRRPDIFARIGDTPIAIEVAFTHFCDAEKLVWIEAHNLTTLEVDIRLPPETALNEMRSALEERLFTTASSSVWLHHAGDEICKRLLDTREQQLRFEHAKADAAFERRAAQKKAMKSRKDEFKALIKDIDAKNIKLTGELTLRIAYSKIRCTMKGHGFFAGLSDHLKHLIIDAGKRFGGEYNKAYNQWEFSPPTDQVIELYRKLGTYIEQRLGEKNPPQKPQEPPVSSSSVEAHRFRDEGERECFEERAAILEFDGCLSRREAEQSAFVQILLRRAEQDNSAV
jgi:hypothetical protein